MTTTPPTPSQTTGNPDRKRRLVLVSIVLGLTLALSGIVWAVVRTRSGIAPPDIPTEGHEPAVVVAVRTARERVAKQPNSARAWGALGQTFLANELEDESLVCFAEAERINPKDPRWPYYQGGTLQNRGEHAAALPYLRRAAGRCAAEGETNSTPQLLLVETLLTLGHLDEAEAEVRGVLARHPDDVRANYDAGLLAAARQDWAAARIHLDRCLDSPFARKKARAQLAAVCQRLGDRATAEEHRREAANVPRDPDWPDPFVAEYQDRAVKKKVRYRLAENLEGAGRFAEAAAVVRPLTVEHRDDYLTHLTLGKLLGQAGDRAGAERSLREALRLAPDMVQTHYYLGVLLFQKGESDEGGGDEERARAARSFQEAAAQAREALGIKPDYGYAHMILGLSLKKLGRRPEALASLRQAVLCNPEFAELHFQLGETLAAEGQKAEARARLELALRLAPPGAAWAQTARDRIAELARGTGTNTPAGPDTP